MGIEKNFLVLDIDGVLLEAYGYRLACIDTVNDFLKQMGQPSLSIDRTTPDIFEASGVTAEWDMIPLILAAFVNWYYLLFPSDPPCAEFPAVLGSGKINDNAAFHKMLAEKAQDYQKMLNPNETPVNAVWHYLSANEGKGLEKLWELPIRDRFFINTLDPRKCQFFAQLMNRLLGTAGFAAFYGLTPPVTCESYLETKDQMLISEYYRDLLQNIAGKAYYPAVMTYRPTLLPSADGNISSKYFVNTPEGECALRLLGWSGGKVPMIGAGSLCYIEEKYDLRREYYVKPHPFHALAAMMAGICRDEILALETARKLCELDPKTNASPVDMWIKPDESIKIMVFEDSVSGINSVKNAAEIMRKWGYNAEAVLFGIRSTGMKNDQLKNAGAGLFDNINEALDTVFKQ